MAIRPNYEVVPGMREQGKGIKIYVESDFAPLKAAIVGDTSSSWMPDPDTPENKNMIEDNASEEFINYLRKHKGKRLEEVDPEFFQTMEYGLNTLAKTLREHGVKVIRNETGTTPEEIVNYATGWGGGKYLSFFPQGAYEVFGHCLVKFWEVSHAWVHGMAQREAIAEIMQNDPEAVWLTMPAPVPNKKMLKPWPFTAAGDVRIMPGKIVVLGIGVSDPSHINDLSKPRSSGDEFGAEVLRRMLKPYGWRVDTVYFDSRLSYHIDCIICPIDEGLIGMQKGALWTPLPDEFKDWEVIDIDPEEQKIGVCNAVPLGNKKIIIPEGAPKLVSELEKRGYTAVEIPYSTIYTTFGSGLHCSTVPIWREY